MTGTAPGIPLGAVTVPLFSDAYTRFTLTQPNTTVLVNTFGQLDSLGRATAVIHLRGGLPAALIGLTLFHAYAVFDLPWTGAAQFASNPFPLTLVH